MTEGWKVSGYWIHQKVRLSSWVTFPFKVKHSCICSEWVTPSQITSEKQDTWNRRPITDGLWTVNAQSDVKVRPGWNTSHQFTNKKSHSVYYITHHFRIQKGVEKISWMSWERRNQKDQYSWQCTKHAQSDRLNTVRRQQLIALRSLQQGPDFFHLLYPTASMETCQFPWPN